MSPKERVRSGLEADRRRTDAAVDWQRDLDQSQTRGLALLAVAGMVTGWALMVPYIVEDTYGALGWSILALTIGGVGTLLFLRRSYRWAALWQVGSTCLAASVVALALPGAFTLGLPALVVMLASALLGPRWATAIAIAVAAILVPVGGLSATVLAAGAALISWLTVRPLQEALAWARNAHDEARQRTAEAERHRGELGRTVKSLNETHERLERVTSELERARAIAENARTLKARFAAYISHELRTPLNLIVGFTHLMVRSPRTYGGEPLPAAYQHDFEAVYQSARHLSALIDDVLDLSQIDAHRMALDRDDVSLADVIAGAADTMAAAFAEKGLALVCDVDATLPLLYLDRTRIRQVLINLLGNALRYTDQGGVTIAAHRVGVNAIVRIADTGRGIAPTELPRLFEEFRQADSGDRTEHEGTGLGLAIARRFVMLHGGWIGVESEPGRGTTFEFGLPIRGVLADDLAPAQESIGKPTARSQYPVVGVLDDDPMLVRFATRYVDGYQVLPISPTRGRDWRRKLDGVVALLVSATGRADPWAYLGAFAEDIGGVPVIGVSLRGTRDAVSRLGATDYLSKPVSPEQLEPVVRRATRGKRTPRILIVDDDSRMVRLLSQMVRGVVRHARVLHALEGGSALDLMQQTVPDLVILDLLMPVVDGYEVLAAMRREDALRDVPVVVVTARGTEDDTVLSGVFAVARSGGITVGEVMRSLQATLDQLNPSPEVRVPPAPRSVHPV